MQTSFNKLGFSIYWNIFFSLKLPSFLLYITKLRLVCLQNRSVPTNFGLMIYITMTDHRLLFCWNIYRVSKWTFKIKQGWETHTKGLSQILPNTSRWILPFLRSQKFLEIFVPFSEITFLTHQINWKPESFQFLEESDREKI